MNLNFAAEWETSLTWDPLLLHTLILRLLEHVEHFSRAVVDMGVVLARKLVS